MADDGADMREQTRNVIYRRTSKVQPERSAIYIFEFTPKVLLLVSLVRALAAGSHNGDNIKCTLFKSPIRMETRQASQR